MDFRKNDWPDPEGFARAQEAPETRHGLVGHQRPMTKSKSIRPHSSTPGELESPPSQFCNCKWRAPRSTWRQ
eukprot:2680062-Pyramimonas_sp.AAC.1